MTESDDVVHFQQIFINSAPSDLLQQQQRNYFSMLRKNNETHFNIIMLSASNENISLLSISIHYLPLLFTPLPSPTLLKPREINRKYSFIYVINTLQTYKMHHINEPPSLHRFCKQYFLSLSRSLSGFLSLSLSLLPFDVYRVLHTIM